MAKINALPSLEVINTLKGTLDFYYWKGIPCVRKWPHIPHSSRTQASLTSAHLFGVIVQGWALVGGAAKTLYWASAADQPRTGRDLYVSGVLGGQHEASMSDFLDLLIESRDYLAALQALLGPLGSVDTDDLQVDIKSALSTLPVRGMDQLFSIRGVLHLHATGNLSAGLSFNTPGVPAGEYWLVTTLSTYNLNRALSKILFQNVHDAVAATIHEEIRAFALSDRSVWAGVTLLDPGDFLTTVHVGGVQNDTVALDVTGYRITIET